MEAGRGGNGSRYAVTDEEVGKKAEGKEGGGKISESQK